MGFRIDPPSTAIVLIDLQKDFSDPVGAFGRGGVRFDVDHIMSRLVEVVESARLHAVLVVSVHYTVPYGPGGRPMFRPEFMASHKFLKSGDFAPGSPGHGLLDPLQSDMSVEKVFPSAFAQSRLELQLRLCNIENLILTGIATNVGVAATFHDARRLGFQTAVLGECCAAKNPAVHEATLASLSAAAYDEPTVITIADLITALAENANQ